MKTRLPCLLLILTLAAGSLRAATERYRVMWRDDPATTMVVAWCQNGGTSPVVHYGTTDQGTNHAAYPLSATPARSSSAKGLTHQFARLSGLQPDTAYYFVVRDSSGTSPRMWFRTAPNTQKAFTYIVGGDSRNNRTPRQQANQLVAKLRPLFVMFGGDFTDTNSNTEWADWLTDWQQTISADGRVYPIVATRGNHDDNLTMVDIFDVPSSNVYYALGIGGGFMRLYTLNSEITVSGTQTTWLTNDLAANSGVLWKVAQYHKPMFPHSTGKAENWTQYDNWAVPFHTHRMNLVVECDSHLVKTTWPVKPGTGSTVDNAFVRDDATGTVYVGEGCWGAPLRPADDAKSYTRNMASFNMIQWVHAHADRMEVRTVGVGNAANVGTVSDSSPFTLPSSLDVWNPSNGAVLTLYPIGSGSGTTPVTVSFQDGTNGYTGTRDTKLRSDATTTNYGTATTLEIDGSPDYCGLVKWDLSAIPAGKTITAVSLTFNVTDISSQMYEIYEVKRAWDEAAATWVKATATVNWATAGANASTDRGTTVLGTISASATGSRTVALNTAGIAVVQAWVNGTASNHGFVIQDYVSNTDGLDFSSSEATTVATRPKITLTYQ